MTEKLSTDLDAQAPVQAPSEGISLWQAGQPQRAAFLQGNYSLRLTIPKPDFSLRSIFGNKYQAAFYLGGDAAGEKLGDAVAFLPDPSNDALLIAEVAWVPTVFCAAQPVYVEYGKLANRGEEHCAVHGTVQVHGAAQTSLNGVTAEYATLSAAVAAATDGATVTLLADITEKISIAGKGIVLDLNGKTLSAPHLGAEEAVLTCDTAGSVLTIRDAAGSTGRINTTADGSCAISLAKGLLELSGGLITASGAKASALTIHAGGAALRGGVLGAQHGAAAVCVCGGTVVLAGSSVCAEPNSFAITLQKGSRLEFNSGAVFGACTGTPAGVAWFAHGTALLPVSASVPAGAVFTVENGAVLTVAKGAELVNSGSILAFGTVHGAVTGGGKVFLSGSALTALRQDATPYPKGALPAYGDLITLRAAAQFKPDAARSLRRRFANDTASFSLRDGTPLGKATAAYEESGATATLQLALSGKAWAFGCPPCEILVEFEGTNAPLLQSPAAVCRVSVRQRPLIISPRKAQSRYYGQSDQPFAFTHSACAQGETPVFTGSLEREPGETAGSYRFHLGTLALGASTTLDRGNYSLSLSETPVDFEIKPYTPAVIAQPAPDNRGSSGWYTGDITVPAPEGYLISRSDALAENDWAASLLYTAQGEGALPYFLKNDAPGPDKGAISAQKTLSLKLDKTVVEQLKIVARLESGALYHYSESTPAEEPLTVALEPVFAQGENPSGVACYYNTEQAAPGTPWHQAEGGVFALNATQHIHYIFRCVTGAGAVAVFAEKPFPVNLFYPDYSPVCVETGYEPGSWTKDPVAFTVSGGLTGAQAQYLACYQWYAAETDAEPPSSALGWFDCSGAGKNELVLTPAVSQNRYYWFRAKSVGGSAGGLSGATLVRQDRSAPSTPALTAAEVTDSSAVLTVRGCKDTDSGVRDYCISEMNKQVPSQTNADGIFRLDGLTSDFPYCFTVTATDQVGNTSITSAPCRFTTAKVPLRGTLALENAEPHYGDTLSVAFEVATPDAGDLTFAWYRDGELIDGASTPLYCLTGSDMGCQLRCTLSAENCAGTLSSETSAPAARLVSSVTLLPTGGQLSKFYDGRPVRDPAAKSEGSTVLSFVWRCGDKTLAGPPKASGSYSVKAVLAPEGGYAGAESADLHFSIYRRKLNVASSVVNDKMYDGTTAAEITLGTVLGLCSGDDVAVRAAAQFSDAEVARGAEPLPKPLMIIYTLSGTDAENYLVPSAELVSAKILPRVLTVTGTSAADKNYDGSTRASLQLGTVTGTLAGDEVFVSAAGEFAGADVLWQNGEPAAQEICLTFAVQGAAAGNYTACAGHPCFAKILPISLRWDTDGLYASKEEDGTDAAEVMGAVRVRGALPGYDAGFHYAGLTARYTQSTPGPKTVAVALIGAELASTNYLLPTEPLVFEGLIRPAFHLPEPIAAAPAEPEPAPAPEPPAAADAPRAPFETALSEPAAPPAAEPLPAETAEPIAPPPQAAGRGTLKIKRSGSNLAEAAAPLIENAILFPTAPADTAALPQPDAAEPPPAPTPKKILPGYTITATAGPGGRIDPPELQVPTGEYAEFTIIPEPAYRIADVFVNGRSIGAINYYIFNNVRVDQTISATFRRY